jgi:starvation-inducible DNA-binding protein
MKDNKKTASDTPATARVALDKKAAIAVAADLNIQLAHLLDLAACAKQAHWNIHGANFQGLHELFDTIEGEVRGHADSIAERSLALGSLAKGTIRNTAASSTLPPFPDHESDWTTLTQQLHSRVLACAGCLRAGLETVASDPVTEDLYIGMIGELEKRAWMLPAHVA